MRSLTVKLIIAFLAVSVAGTLLLAGVMGRLTATEFGSYIVSEEQAAMARFLGDFYSEQRSWEGVDAILADTTGGNRAGRGPGGGMGQGAGGPGRGQGRQRMTLVDSDGMVVAAGAGYSVGEQVAAATLQRGAPIVVEGQLVGTVLQMRGAPVMSAAGNAFLGRINLALALAATGATVLALALGVLLARTLTKPLRELTNAAYAVAQGELGRTVAVHSQDEMGKLAHAFNQMSADLAQGQARRQQMTADIAHDLRTPVSIIQGHAEALRDGVLPPTAETFALIHDEALRLNRMVEDLRTLSRAEAGELPLLRRMVNVAPWLQSLVEAQQPRAAQRDIRLQAHTDDATEAVLHMDGDRMAQVVNNLIENALRHSPPGSVVRVGARHTDHSIVLFVQDNGPGIAAEDLPHLFERFYRGDKSRRRHEGGSGLGLAIARSIVLMHGGAIHAENVSGGGAIFTVTLPLHPPLPPQRD